jgi:hypothetical protein
LGAGTHGVDDHGIVGVDAEDADLKQVAIVGGTDAHREVVIELPLRDGVADRVEHVVVCDAVLSSRLRDTHGMTRYLVGQRLSRYLAKEGGIGSGSGDRKPTAVSAETALESQLEPFSPSFVSSHQRSI